MTRIKSNFTWPKSKVPVKYDGKFVVSFNFTSHMNPLSEVVAFALAATSDPSRSPGSWYCDVSL